MKNTITALENMGSFWTRIEELVEDVNETVREYGFEVVEQNDEYITLDNSDTDEVVVAYLGHANSTMWIDRVKGFEI